jgi:hypothetical protein
MVVPDDITVSAYHEAGHSIIGALIGVPVSFVTIEHPAHCTISLRGILKICISDTHRAIFFLSGVNVQHYYYPDSEDISEKDRAVLWGLSDRRREAYTEFILQKLEDPAVRMKIEDLADRLITDISIEL